MTSVIHVLELAAVFIIALYLLFIVDRILTKRWSREFRGEVDRMRSFLPPESPVLYHRPQNILFGERRETKGKLFGKSK